MPSSAPVLWRVNGDGKAKKHTQALNLQQPCNLCPSRCQLDLYKLSVPLTLPTTGHTMNTPTAWHRTHSLFNAMTGNLAWGKHRVLPCCCVIAWLCQYRHTVLILILLLKCLSPVLYELPRPLLFACTDLDKRAHSGAAPPFLIYLTDTVQILLKGNAPHFCDAGTLSFTLEVGE